MHRDIKPENIIFANCNINSPIKLIDFGISTQLRGNHQLKKKVGTVNLQTIAGLLHVTRNGCGFLFQRSGYLVEWNHTGLHAHGLASSKRKVGSRRGPKVKNLSSIHYTRPEWNLRTGARIHRAATRKEPKKANYCGASLAAQMDLGKRPRCNPRKECFFQASRVLRTFSSYGSHAACINKSFWCWSLNFYPTLRIALKLMSTSRLSTRIRRARSHAKSC